MADIDLTPRSLGWGVGAKMPRIVACPRTCCAILVAAGWFRVPGRAALELGKPALQGLNRLCCGTRSLSRFAPNLLSQSSHSKGPAVSLPSGLPAPSVVMARTTWPSPPEAACTGFPSQVELPLPGTRKHCCQDQKPRKKLLPSDHGAGGRRDKPVC